MNDGKVTDRDREIAIRVLMKSKYVRHWVLSQMNFLGVDINTPEGKSFFGIHARRMAERFLE